MRTISYGKLDPKIMKKKDHGTIVNHGDTLLNGIQELIDMNYIAQSMTSHERRYLLNINIPRQYSNQWQLNKESSGISFEWETQSTE